jgi:hypothetical protein
MHQPQCITNHPGFCNLSTGDAVYDDAFNPDRFVGRSNPAQLSLVRARRSIPSSHEIICLNDLTNLELKIGKRIAIKADDLLLTPPAPCQNPAWQDRDGRGERQ